MEISVKMGQPKKLVIRVPEALHASIAFAAAANNRTINAEVVECLHNGIPDMSMGDQLLAMTEGGIPGIAEGRAHAFLRLAPACQRNLAIEASKLMRLAACRMEQAEALALMQEKGFRTGILESLPPEKARRRIKAQYSFQYDLTHQFFKAGDEATAITKDLPKKRLVTAMLWNTLEQILDIPSPEMEQPLPATPDGQDGISQP